MGKVELAKMLGLEMVGYDQSPVSMWEINELEKFEYQTIERKFTGDISVEIDQEDFSKGSVLLMADAEEMCRQCNLILWERAAEEYLGKIKTLVETIKI